MNFDLTCLEVDWEYPDPGQQATDYTLLMAAVRAYLPSPRYLVSTALPAAEWCLNRFDLRQLASSIDLLNLMAYDFTGNWGDQIVSGHHGEHFLSLVSACPTH
jgi:chitinase